MAEEIKNTYSQLLEYKLPENNRLELCLINKETNKRYEMPVVTKNCKVHPRNCYEFQEALKKLEKDKKFRCTLCNVEVTQLHEFVKDIRWQAYQEFNELTTDIQIVNGMMFNKFQKSYLRLKEIIEQQNFFKYLKDIYSRFSQQNSINKLIVKQISVTQSQRQKNQKVFYWAFCLLDKIKITVPIRILNCNHIECYDLSSILRYHKEIQDKNNLQFQCRMPGCKNKLIMATLDELFAGIVIDKDLLTVIKKCNPSLYKFYFNLQTLNLDEETKVVNQKKVDFAIFEYYQKILKKDLNDEYFQFQDEVQRKVVQIITNDLDGKDNLLKYKTYEISMKDPIITDLNIEYPARCKNCKDLNQYIDLRIFIASFLTFKEVNPNQKFKCILCNNLFDKNSSQINQLQNYLCIEGNLLFPITKDMSYIQTGKFQYEGEKYMLQEFMERQKYPIVEYKQKLYEANQSQEVNYVNLFCASRENQPLEYPLLLKNCKSLKILDFSTFYQQLKATNFDLSKGIKFCSCDYCNMNLIKDITGNIYFHEGIYEMLQILKQNKVQIQQRKLITFNFEKMVQVNTNYFTPSDENANKNMKGQEGFTNLMDDEVYQRIFSTKKIGKWDFKITSIDQSLCDGIYSVHDKNGVTCNLEQKMTQINQYAEQTDLAKWNFKVVQMQVEFKDEIIQTNKGKIQSTQFQ